MRTTDELLASSWRSALKGSSFWLLAIQTYRMSGYRKIYMTVGLTIATCLLLLQYKNAILSQYDFKQEEVTIAATTPRASRTAKTILYWTPMFGELDFDLGLGTKMFENCTYTNCYATYHKDEIPIENVDAIIFHAIQYKEDVIGQPKRRKPEQVYIFANLESPVHTPSFIDGYNYFYNWTMTYRLDSDVVRAYGFVEKNATHFQPPSVEEIRKRPKKIAWFVSQCETFSERERLYKELKKHVQIDVYGACGDLKCPRLNSNECYTKIEREYKFYLSFENSVCEDYVTEKLYNILKRNIVPIVYGGADYSTLAPPQSVINVMDFASVENLVTYIKYLDTHPEEYLKYFEWKKSYVVDTSSERVVCSLCKRLHEDIVKKSYGNLARWWRGWNSDKCSNDFIKQFL